MRSDSLTADSAADRIITVACRLMAQNGIESTSLRAVARAAGVSAPLVVHHFGSKSGMIAACDARVSAAIDAVLAPLRDGGGFEASASGWIDLLSKTPYLGYVTQSLREGGDVGARLFDEIYTLALETDRAMETAGIARPTDDHELRALLLMTLDLGVLLLSDHVERTLGKPIGSPEIAKRWVRGVEEILTGGVLNGPITPTAPPREVSP
jgi:TetR/AcrR family transcriptional regulator, regulator of cefoperazone and chloramphenicol sensitivity